MAVRPGQVLSLDATAALTVLLLFMAGVFVETGFVERAATGNAAFNELEREAVAASDVLTITRGDPPYWYLDGAPVHSLGLARQDHVLDDEKLVALADIDEQRLRHLLGVDAFNIQVSLVNASTGAVDGCTVGGDAIRAGAAPVDATAEARIDRLVRKEDGTRCALQVVVWR